MTDTNSVEEIIDFAIGQEEEAFEFYTDLAGKMDREWMKKVFLDFAQEEKGHKLKLLEIKAGKRPLKKGEDVQDLKIADYLIDVNPDDDALDYQKALILAMKKEKAAFRMYSDLAELASDTEVSEMLTHMAQEEARHKLRFETEYDDNFTDEAY